MKVEKVSANIRYSKAQEDGAWKMVELAAEGTVEPLESWQTAQAVLYAQLTQQLKALWGNGNGNGHHKTENGAVVAAEAPAVPEPIREPPPAQQHYCQEHQTEFKRHEGKNGAAWFSHKTADGWCREK